MEAVHIHLALSHAPLFLTAAATLALVLAVFWQREGLTRFGLILMILAAIVAVPVFLSGEPSESVAEGLAGVSEAAIERHEEAAGTAMIIVGILGGVALVSLLALWRRCTPRLMPVGAGVLAVLGLLALGYVASLGGQIRHTEIASEVRGSTIEQAGPDRTEVERSARERDDEY